jgi:hypothetical protein
MHVFCHSVWSMFHLTLSIKGFNVDFWRTARYLQCSILRTCELIAASDSLDALIRERYWSDRDTTPRRTRTALTAARPTLPLAGR